MPHADPDKRRASQAACKKKRRAKLHAEKYGPDAGDQRGKHQNHRKAADHPRWQDGSRPGSTGHVKVRVGQDHPLADPNGWAYEHLVVWVSAGNPRPKRGEDYLH